MAKKDFTKKLAEDRISIVKEILDTAEQTSLPVEDQSKKQPKKQAEKTTSTGETKSRRVNVLFTQSMYNSLSAIATMQRESVNEVITQAVAEYVKQHAEDLQAFDSVFNKGK